MTRRKRMVMLVRLAALCVLVCFLSSVSVPGPSTTSSTSRPRHHPPPVCPQPPASPDTRLLTLPDIFSQVATVEGGSNIFLLESSCVTSLEPRVWCALESVAQQNPEARVWLVMSSGVLKEDNVSTTLLQQYPNIHPVTAHPSRALAHTPLLSLYASHAWRTNTSWPEINLGDLLRLGLVWELGGLYLDSDVVCLRSLSSLSNFLAWQDRSTLGSGAFHFTPRHPVLGLIMQHARRSFRADVWGTSGPRAFTSAVHEHCGREVAAGSLAHCPGLTVLPITAFYPVPATVWRLIFTPQRPRGVAKRYPGSYLLHTWRTLSRGHPVTRGSGCIYDQAAAEFCPTTRTLVTALTPTY